MDNNDKLILVFIGPSGCGKSTLVKELFAKSNIEVTPSYTDRPTRLDEGEFEHIFVSAYEMNRLIKSNKFLEVVKPFGLKFRYGLPKITRTKNRISTILLRENFVPLLASHYPNFKLYQIESNFEFASRNVLSRNDVEVGSRLLDFNKEIENGRVVADRVFVNSYHNKQRVLTEIISAIKTDFEL